GYATIRPSDGSRVGSSVFGVPHGSVPTQQTARGNTVQFCSLIENSRPASNRCRPHPFARRGGNGHLERQRVLQQLVARSKRPFSLWTGQSSETECDISRRQLAAE